jgi:DNA-binding transcriptional MerR regulator
LETAQKVAKSTYKSDMKVDMYLRTKDLAQAVHISVQQVRNYEASGFIPAVERSSSGYRRYTRQHLVALKTARHLIGAYGRPLAQQIMQAVHQGTLSTALALIDERHAELARTRLQLEQTLAALSILAAQLRSERHCPLEIWRTVLIAVPIVPPMERMRHIGFEKPASFDLVALELQFKPLAHGRLTRTGQAIGQYELCLKLRWSRAVHMWPPSSSYVPYRPL